MVILGTWRGERLTVSVRERERSLTVSTFWDGGLFTAAYEGGGRPRTFITQGTVYRRALDGRMLAKWRPKGMLRQRRWLSQEEALALEAKGRALLQALYADFQAGRVEANGELPPLGHTLFQRAIAWDEAKSRADAQRYREIYLPIGILPPDQYSAIVLQATLGCSFNTCTFCTFYRDRPFRIKAPDEFKQHALAVKDFIGEGIYLRHGIFLGDANALVVPMRRLVPLMEAALDVFPQAWGGFYAFLDGFSGEKKTAQDYAQLASLGLKRVYIGMESGHAPLLHFLHKPGEPEDVLHTVKAMKAGGVAVGIIILIGAGGHVYADAHVRDTIALLNAMPLDDRDMIYFSELVVTDDMPYARDAAAANLRPLTHEECVAQEKAIRSGLRFQGKRPIISRYDIREFVY
ncbi:MAG: radical SAM protein [Chloroflexi bacterium]|nr:radical SAM protein [Chloroflexota bacterium]